MQTHMCSQSYHKKDENGLSVVSATETEVINVTTVLMSYLNQPSCVLCSYALCNKDSFTWAAITCATGNDCHLVYNATEVARVYVSEFCCTSSCSAKKTKEKKNYMKTVGFAGKVKLRVLKSPIKRRE